MCSRIALASSCTSPAATSVKKLLGKRPGVCRQIGRDDRTVARGGLHERDREPVHRRKVDDGIGRAVKRGQLTHGHVAEPANVRDEPERGDARANPARQLARLSVIVGVVELQEKDGAASRATP